MHDTKTKYGSVLNYFAADPNMPSHDFFSILTTFIQVSRPFTLHPEMENHIIFALFLVFHRNARDGRTPAQGGGEARVDEEERRARGFLWNPNCAEEEPRPYAPRVRTSHREQHGRRARRRH
jgi:hypothetical protein